MVVAGSPGVEALSHVVLFPDFTLGRKEKRKQDEPLSAVRFPGKHLVWLPFQPHY